MTALLITLTGPDRPGMVSAISDCAAAHGANWHDSLMANFDNTFAGIVHLQVPAERVAALSSALQALDAADFRVTVTQAAGGVQGAQRQVEMELVGHDRPGIIRAISGQLAALGVSIHKLQTHTSSGAMSGEQLFHVQARLGVPQGVDADALRSGLESLANELMVDLRFDAP